MFGLALLGVFLGKALGSPVLGMVVVAFVALATPGALISTAIDGDWLHALNPLLWLQVMLRLGMPYLLLAGLCLLIVISKANAQQFMLPLFRSTPISRATTCSPHTCWSIASAATPRRLSCCTSSSRTIRSIHWLKRSSPMQRWWKAWSRVLHLNARSSVGRRAVRH